MIINTTLNGDSLTLFIVGSHKIDYKRLAQVLLDLLTNEQMNNITNTFNNKTIIFFSDIDNKFNYEGCRKNECGKLKCICNASIKYQHIITNKASNIEYTIGSVCKDHWARHDGVAYYCKYCDNKKKSGTDCADCKGKHYMKSVFSSWRNLMNKKVDFGKFRGMSYYRLVNTKPDYCNWIIENSNTSQSRKNTIKELM